MAFNPAVLYFRRASDIKTVSLILGIILSAGMMIGSVVLFILRLVNKGDIS